MSVAIIVEDEHKEAVFLESMLKKIQKDLEVRLFENGLEALAFIEDDMNMPDVFFLDLRLPGMDGFTLAGKIREMEKHYLTPIVFVTGNYIDELNPFQEYHCYEYIRKPLNGLAETKLEKLLGNLGQRKEKPKFKKAVLITTKEGELFFLVDDIIGLEAQRKNCYVYTEAGRVLAIRRSVDQLLEEINVEFFVKCHRSFAVNLAYVVQIPKVGRNVWNPVLHKGDQFKCQISKTYYADVMDHYKNYLERMK